MASLASSSRRCRGRDAYAGSIPSPRKRSAGDRRIEPTAPPAAFLRSLARAYDEGLSSVVLTRFFDELHRDHFHLDMAR